MTTERYEITERRYLPGEESEKVVRRVSSLPMASALVYRFQNAAYRFWEAGKLSPEIAPRAYFMEDTIS